MHGAANGTPYKTCPYCRQPAVMTMQVCGRSSRAFPPLNPSTPVKKRSPPPLLIAVPACGGLLLFVAIFGVVSGGTRHSTHGHSRQTKIVSFAQVNPITPGWTQEQIRRYLGEPQSTS